MLGGRRKDAGAMQKRMELQLLSRFCKDAVGSRDWNGGDPDWSCLMQNGAEMKKKRAYWKDSSGWI